VATIETLVQGDSSRLVEPRQFVVRDRGAFTAVWAAHAGPDSSPPPVDFDTRMVVAVFAGERPTPGYEITITGTRRDGPALVVIVTERSPDPTLISAQIITSPFHIVTLPRDDGEIRFDAPTESQPQTIVFKPPKPSSLRARTPAARVPPADDSGDANSPSSTGLRPELAATMAYLAGPFSGVLILATERTSRFVRFHAWQALFALGVLGAAAVAFLMLAFALLIVSPTAFWAMLWLSALTGAAWVVVWALCLLHAYKGQRWKLPVAGDYAERYT
jgi:uncharacterized membrane protein